MAADFELQGIFRVKDESKSGIQSASRGLDDLGDAAQDSSKKTGVLKTSLTELKSGLDLALGAARTFGEVARQAFEFAEAGAAIRQTRENFDSLGLSIETLRASVNNTVPDMTLMSGTLTLTAGSSGELRDAYAKAVPQLLEMSKAAAKLNPTLGDTAFMYESLSTAAKRQSTQIADNLGIIVKQGPAYEKYAASVGKSVAELNDQEKALAFLNELLESGNTLIEQAGGNVDSLTDSYSQLRTNLTNATDALKEQAAQSSWLFKIIGGGVKNYADWYQAANVTEKSIFGLNGAIESARLFFTGTNKTIQEFNASLNEQGRALKSASGDLLQYAATFSNPEAALNNLSSTISTTVASIDVLGVRSNDSASAMDAYNLAIQSATASSDAAAYQQSQLAAAEREAQQAALDAKSAFYDQAAALDEMSISALAYQQIDVLRQSINDTTFTQEDFNESQRAILSTFGLLTPAEIAAQERIDALTQARLDGELGNFQYARAVMETKDAVDVLTRAESEAEAEAQRLADENMTAAEKTAMLNANVADAEAVLYGMQGGLDSVTSSAGTAGDAVSTLQSDIDKLQDKSITVNVEYNVPTLPSTLGGPTEPFTPQAFARGGTIGTNDAVWVGDNGPELLYGAKGAHVINNNRSTQITNQFGGININTSLGIERMLTESRRSRMRGVRI